ncbi:hypothetical protein ACFFJT_00470 [Dyella flava]|uniref:Chitin-binding type-2 domain-containing protein n=1 Tax=Dyella flava TaxID=1920170 RepID=A0ABS2JYX8_9GAMM|nr:hypothetical protein [Dyella flava]MBM7124207.1 hypothetical protein [Dyella flava]
MPPQAYPHGPVGAGAYARPLGPGPVRLPGNFHHFEGHDFAHFSPADQAMWRGGGWRHEFHNGRWGWWWFVGGAWYFYDQPVYPYPVFVSDVVYEEPVEEVQTVEPVDPGAPPPPVEQAYPPGPPQPVGQVDPGAPPQPVEQVDPGAPPQPVQQVDPAAPPQPTGRVYYYCPGVGYYPQVATCSVPFQVVTN